MAKFLMMTGPYAGHIAPCAPIVKKLVEGGHQVAWITGRQYRHRVETTGAVFYPLPAEIDPGGKEIYEFFPELGKKKGIAQMKWFIKHVLFDACEREIETTDSVLEGFQADVLLGDSVAVSLFFRSEMGGPPSACIALLPMSIPSRDTAPFGTGFLPGKNIITRFRNNLLNIFVQHGLLRDVTTYANDVRKGLGLSPVQEPFFSALPKTISLIMHISTPAFEYRRSDAPEHLYSIGPIIPEADNTFRPPSWWPELEKSRPVILVNQGTIATILDDLIIPAIQGLKDEEVVVVAVPVKEGELSGSHKNVHVEPFIPFAQLLPHVDVMVTNGGYGSTQLALSHGIPLVVAGATEDKREVASRVEWSGAGINLRKHRPSPDEIKNAVKEVLVHHRYRKNAEHIQTDFAKYDAPAKAVSLLEALVAGDLPPQ